MVNYMYIIAFYGGKDDSKNIKKHKKKHFPC